MIECPNTGFELLTSEVGDSRSNDYATEALFASFVILTSHIYYLNMLVKCHHRINTQPEVRLRVGAFDVGVLVFSAAAIFLASVHGKCLRYTEDVDVVFAKKNSSLLTLERGR